MEMDILVTLGKAALGLFMAASAFMLWSCAALSGRLDDLEEIQRSPTTRPSSR